MTRTPDHILARLTDALNSTYREVDAVELVSTTPGRCHLAARVWDGKLWGLNPYDTDDDHPELLGSREIAQLLQDAAGDGWKVDYVTAAEKRWIDLYLVAAAPATPAAPGAPCPCCGCCDSVSATTHRCTECGTRF